MELYNADQRLKAYLCKIIKAILKNKNHELDKVLLGIVAGAAIGALAGILLAPEEGNVTRRFISKKGKEYAGNLEEKFNGLMDNLNEKIESVKEQVSRLIADVKK